MKIKQRIFEIIQVAEPDDKIIKVFDISLMSLIILNVCLVIADTFALNEITRKIFYYIEAFSVVIFTIEYILRVWTADCLFPDKKYPRTAPKRWMQALEVLSVLQQAFSFFTRD